jgi:hypothetical protein
MAKGKKTGGRDFQHGNKANPLGGGAVSPVTRAIRKITAETLLDVADLLLDGTIERVEQLAVDRSAPMIKVLLARGILEDHKKGTTENLERILNRTIGKPKDKVELSGAVGGNLAAMTDAELASRFESLMAAVNGGRKK